jgi:phage gp29-like protein
MKDITDLSRETIDTDPHLGAVLNKRIGGVAGLRWELIPAAGTGIDQSRAAEYAEIVREQLLNVPRFHERIAQLAWVVWDGRAALENDWRLQSGEVRWVIEGLGWIHPRRIAFGPERELRVYDASYGAFPFSEVGVALNDMPFKFVQAVRQLFGDYPEREGLSRRALHWSFFKRFGARERMILAELFGKPWRILEVPEDSSADGDDLDDADEIIAGLGGHTSARLPRGTKLEVVQPQRTAGAVHADIIKDSDEQISKLVLGQTGTTDASPAGMGSAMHLVMRDEQLMILQRDAAAISEAFEDHLTDAIIELNFGAEALTHAPRFVLRSDLPADRNTELERLKRSLEAGLAVAVEEAYEVSGFRQPVEEESVVRIANPPSHPLAVAAPAPRAVIEHPEGQVPEPKVQEQQSKPEPGEDDEDDDTLPPPPPTEPAPQPPLTEPPEEAPPGEGEPLRDRDDNRPRLPRTAGGAPAPGATNPNATRAHGGVALAPAQVLAVIRQEGTKWVIYSEDGTRKLGEFDTREEAEERLAEIERIKRIREQASKELDGLVLLSADAPAVGENSPHGVLEVLIGKGQKECGRLLAQLGRKVRMAAVGAESYRGAMAALRAVRLDEAPLARAFERRLVHALALGSRESLADGTGAEFDGGVYVRQPYAMINRTRGALQRADYERMGVAAKAKAYRMAAVFADRLVGAARQTITQAVVERVSVQAAFADGGAYDAQLDREGLVASDRLVALALRAGLVDARASGRLAEMARVKTERPLWQVRASKRRLTHAAVDGWVVAGAEEVWSRCYPPFGFDCACRVVALSADQSFGLPVRNGAEIVGLPDAGHGVGGALYREGLSGR